MNKLNNNIIEFILNKYLSYKKDVSKVKQLYDYNLHIKLHLSYQEQISAEGKITITFLDSQKIKEEAFYVNNQKMFEVHIKNDKEHGIWRGWHKTGELEYEFNY